MNKLQAALPSWNKNLGRFKEGMMHKIRANMKEKGLSWRGMSEEELLKLMLKFIQRKDWTSAANIAFFLWENADSRKDAEEKGCFGSLPHDEERIPAGCINCGPVGTAKCRVENFKRKIKEVEIVE